MANEIYNRTYWGDAINTANIVNDKPSFFKSQFDLKDRVTTETSTFEAQLCVSDNLHKIANL